MRATPGKAGPARQFGQIMPLAPTAPICDVKKLMAPRVLVAAPGWHIRRTAESFVTRGAFAGLWLVGRKKRFTNFPPEKVRCCQLFHFGMLPFYFWAPQIWSERMFYAFLPIWRTWFRAQPLPDCNVVHAITGFATEPFDRAEKLGALKVADCPNSHPTSLYGIWQRECDLWCPGKRCLSRSGCSPA